MQHLTMRVAGVIGVLVVTVAVLSSCAGHVYAVVGQAMEPNFVEGQTITAIPFDPAQLQRGDPVIYQLDNGDIHFKRVVGLPGESIQIVGGRVYIDGVTLSEPYLSAGPMMDDSPMSQGVASPVSAQSGGSETAIGVTNDTTSATTNGSMVARAPGTNLAEVNAELGDGEFFILGDNRANSYDSRAHGPVTSTHILGRVKVTWLNRLTSW